MEVDFVAKKGDNLLAIEVKSGLHEREHMALKAFQKKFPHAKALLVGKNGIPLDEFLSFEISYWVDKVR